MLSPDLENWAQAAKEYFAKGGASGKFAIDVARLYVALYVQGLNPRITRIFSDGKHQRDLQARWDSGNRAGLRVRPATTSKHTETTFLGQPAANAVDMPCNDDLRGAKIATSLGIGAGAGFSTPDIGHYYSLK